MCEETVAVRTVALELEPLREVAAARGWELETASKTLFVLGLVARDGEKYWLKVDCSGYHAMPPAWHWLDRDTGATDRAESAPRGAGYFHGNNVICAPWNRLAYRDQNPKGPHGDWTIGDWRANPKTGECKTLCAMALKIAHQLRTSEYHGRKAA